MSSAAELSVTLEGKDVGLSTLLTQVDAKTQASANSAIRLEQQYARLAQAQGNTAQATGILSNALLNNGGASASALTGVATQLTRVQQGSTGLGTAISGLSTQMGGLSTQLGGVQQFGASAAASLTSMIGPAALASAAIGGVISVGKSFADAFQFKTQLDQSTASIKVLLNGVRDSGEVFAGAARFANTYKLTQEETTGAIQASIPVIRNSKASIEDILGVFARLKVLNPDKTFSDAARALGELQAGQVQSIVQQFNLSRTAANQMKKEIDGGADAVVVLSKYLTNAGVGMDALAVSTQGAAGKMRELAQEQEALKLAQAEFAQGPGMALLQTQIQATSGVTRLLSNDTASMGQAVQQAAQEGSFGFQLLNGIMGGTLTRFADATAQATAYATTQASTAAETTAAAAQTAAYSAEIQRSGDSAAAAAAGEAAYAESIRAQAQAALDASGATAALSELTGQAASISTAFGAAMDTERSGITAAADATRASTQAIADDITKKLESTAATQNLAAVQATLASLGGQVASGLLTSAQAAAVLASQYGFTASQARVLLAAQAALANVPAPTSFTDERGAIRQNAARDQIATSVAQRKATDDQNAAEAAYQKTLGNSGPTIARIRGEMAGLVVGSTAYINKQNELAKAQESADKKAKGGGGAKLSDQTKLNNSLLTQQEDYQQKSEDAHQAHADEVLKIEADFAAKVAAQEKLNEVSKRQSEADFLDNLTSSDLNKAKGEGKDGKSKSTEEKKLEADALKRIDADYFAAFDKAQQLAQSGRAKLGADYLALKQKQADQELSFEEKLATARQKKDTGEVSRLEAIQALRRQAAAEEEKQLLAGGDQNVNDKDKALADAAQKESDAQDKIGTASDRATARKVENAKLAGKAVDDELTKVNSLETAYTGLGARTPLATGGQPPATTTPTPATPQAAGGDVLGALNAIRSAVDNAATVFSANVSATKGVESAVKGIRLSVPGVS